MESRMPKTESQCIGFVQRSVSADDTLPLPVLHSLAQSVCRTQWLEHVLHFGSICTISYVFSKKYNLGNISEIFDYAFLDQICNLISFFVILSAFHTNLSQIFFVVISTRKLKPPVSLSVPILRKKIQIRKEFNLQLFSTQDYDRSWQGPLFPHQLHFTRILCCFQLI